MLNSRFISGIVNDIHFIGKANKQNDQYKFFGISVDVIPIDLAVIKYPILLELNKSSNIELFNLGFRQLELSSLELDILEDEYKQVYNN